MATIDELRAEGKELVPYETWLDVGEFDERWIAFSPSGLKWFQERLPNERVRGAKMQPLEQVEQIFHDYIIGRTMAYGTDRKRLEPDRDYTWEFRTPHIRVFGWLPRRRHFIVVNGEMRNRIKRHADFAPYIQEVVTFRNGLNLDTPKYLEGIQANEIC